MKKNISSVELAALIKELQFVERGKVSQIYHQDKKELLLQLHAIGQGKQLLKIVPGKFLCLTHEKHPPLRPTGFCMQLRKYISNASIKKLYQQGSERIVVFELEKKEKFYLIIELFSKGNIILTDKNFVIIGTLERQIWKDRSVVAKEKYVFPTPGVDWKKLTSVELGKVLKKSDKKNLATSLATKVGLGGVFAEEVCARSEVDGKLLPYEGDAAKLLKGIKSVMNEDVKGYIYDVEITPFRLNGKEVKQEVETYNEAVNTIKAFVKSSPYEKKIAALCKIIEGQEDNMAAMEQDIKDNTAKGDLIYEKYEDLRKLVEYAQGDWRVVSKELKKLKKIDSVDMKNRKVVIEL